MPEPSARQIEVFRMVMRLGSANRAASALHISQPAVTQLLQQMEERSGLRLFGRTAGKLMPTPEAHALIQEVERVYEGLDAVQRKIVALQSHEDQVLRIGSLHAMASSIMPLAVAQFQRSYPRMRFLLSVDSSTSLRDALFKGSLDLAFLGDEADISGVDASVFYEVDAVCAVPASHPLTRKARVSLRDLQDAPLIGLSANDPAQRRLEAALRQAKVVPRTVIETPYSATQCSLVLTGAGLAVTNPLVARAFAPLGLRCLALDAPLVFRAMLGFRPQQAQSRSVQEFVAVCRSVLQGYLP